MFACIHLAQKEGWWLINKTIATHTSFFFAQQKHNSIISPNNQIIVTTHAHFIDTDKGGIRNQKENKTEIKTSTPLIKDLKISNIFKNKDNKEKNGVMDKLINEVL